MIDLSRRRFLGFSAVHLGSGLNLDCIGIPAEEAPETNDGRLTARPVAVTGSVLTGTTALNLGGARDGLLFVPSGYKPESPAPLIVLLHGAGGSGTGVFQRFASAVEPVGQYAVKLVFDDGHDTGLFTWKYLRELGEKYSEKWAK